MLTATDVTLEQLIDQSSDYDSQKSDYTIQGSQLSFFEFDGIGHIQVPDNELAMLFDNVGGTDTTFTGITEHAHYQLCQKWGYTLYGTGSNKSLPHEYLYNLRNQHPDIWADNLNRHSMKATERKLFIRGYGDNVRAVLSDRYSPIDNTDLLTTLDKVVQSSELANLKILRGSHLSPDAMGLKAQFFERPTDSDGSYLVGVYIGNNEVGNGKIRIAPMVQRTNCQNSIIVDSMNENAVAFRHIGSELATKVISTSVITRCLQLADKVVDQAIEGYSHAVQELDKVLAGFAQKYKLTDTAKTNLGIGSAFGGSTPNTKTGFVNAITYMAHTSDLNHDDQEQLEMVAGHLLMSDNAKFDQTINGFAKLAR